MGREERAEVHWCEDVRERDLVLGGGRAEAGAGVRTEGSDDGADAGELFGRGLVLPRALRSEYGVRWKRRGSWGWICVSEYVGRHLRGGCGGRRGGGGGCGGLVVRVIASGVPDGNDAGVRKEAVHVAHELFVPAPIGILVLH